MKYRVRIHYQQSEVVEVETDDEEAAFDLAWQKVADQGLDPIDGEVEEEG